MGFITQPMDEHTEKEPLPDGEYRLRIKNYKVNEMEDGTPRGVVVFHEVDGEPDAKDIVFNVNLVLPTDDDNKKYWKLAFQKGYLKKFGLDWKKSGFDPEEWLGAEADVNLRQETLEDGTIINRFDVSPVT